MCLGQGVVKPSIRKKIILFTVVPVTLFYNLLSALHIYTSFKESSHEIEIQMRNNVVHFAHTLDAYTKEIMSQASAQTWLLQTETYPTYPLLHSILASSPFLTRVCWIDTKNTVASACINKRKNKAEPIQLPELPPTELGKNWSQLLGPNEYWSTLYRDSKTGKRLVSFIVPCRHPGDGRMLKLDVDINRMVHDVINPKLFEGRNIGINLWKFNMVDRSGDYLYSDSVQANRFGHKNLRQTGEVYGIEGFGDHIEQWIDSGRAETFRAWIPNPQYQKEYWFFGAPVSSSQWWLYTSVSRQHALQGVLDIALVDIAIMLISLLLILGGILYVSKKITHPLITLKSCMDTFIEHHKLVELPDTGSRDEAGSLARSFVKLTQWLDARDKALHQARANNMGHIVQGLKGRYFYFQLNTDGEIVHISRSVESVLGYRSEEFKGPLENFLSNDPGNHSYKTNFEKVLRGEPVEAFELDIQNKHGHSRRIELFWNAMTSGQQRVIEGLANDVTERVSDTLKFKALLDSAPDAMIILNPDGIIVMVNSRAVELLGFPREDLINMPLSLLVPPQFREKHPLLCPLLDRAWKQTRLFRQETKAVDRQGRIFPAELTSNPLITRDGVLISVVIRDITESKQIEQALLTAHDEAITASRSKSLFLSCMSHELRTPLNGVIGYAQVLQRSGGLNPGQHQKLAILERCGQHLLTLINDILDLTKIETQGVDLHPVSVDLRQLLLETRELFVPKAEHKDLQLILNIDEQVPDWVEVDEVKLRQILTNLLGNAIKYTEEGSVEIEIYTGSDRLFFSVKDTGVGIDPKDFEIIFDPFRQLDEGLKSGGTGLGLAISRHLVKAMGDDLTVTSNVGQGSCFQFSIPLKEAPALDTDNVFSSDQVELILPDNHTYTALIVDDLEINRDLLKVIMEEAGFRTLEACDGLEALACLEARKPELVMMDIRMPRMDGIEALKHIRLNPELRNLKVIAVTASAGSDIKTRLKQKGFDGVLAKPFRVNHLLQVVASLLNLDLKESQLPLDMTEASELPQLDETHKKALLRKVSQVLEFGDIQELSSITEEFREAEMQAYCQYLTQIAEACDMDQLEKFYEQLKRQPDKSSA
ncbi:PAS domain-containing hybrid sensor histidine kinase/response regulator [Endozoicomonas numazuensis]|uniref:PAS domain-containing hybrid sensor histidine kinase/response regulator n=1 Tax=Endozoicomonas numazuensis TaxID=1137799 RepID=UPI001F16ECD2|nr:PAS domain S-box protein [Endozoicomonas numazuensis]